MARAATKRRRNVPGFNWLTKKRVTYHRAVGKERTQRKREAMAERREALAIKKLRAQELAADAAIKAAERKIAAAEKKIESGEKKLDRGGMAEAQFEAMKARLEREIEAQERHKAAAMAKGNPSWGYGIYEGGGFTTRQVAHFKSKAAAETWARSQGLTGYSIKRAFAKDQNPQKPAEHLSTEYQLGYSLGQRDRETASLRRTPAEIEATFRAKFDPARASTLVFAEGYEAGYGTAAAPNGRRRNPEPDDEDEKEQARKIAALFHGRPVKEEITVTEQIREHDWLWRIGSLVSLKVKTIRKQRATFKFSQKEGEVVHVFCSPDGKQMYLRDGDTTIDLKPLGLDGDEWKRDRMVIGQITQLTYRDRKAFYHFAETDFYHFLGEESKVKPLLVYDTLSEKLEIVGGKYFIDTTDLVDDTAGGSMSPGLRD